MGAVEAGLWLTYNAVMAVPGIKIKALAQELGVTSRAVIDRCRAEGLWVQNSVTKLTSAQAARVRTWFDDVARKP